MSQGKLAPSVRVDIARCGRGVASNICDPDGVVSQSEADRVEGVIKDIRAGVDPYIRKQCGDKMEGYMVAVALMQSMEVPPGVDPGVAAASFAHELHSAWGVGSAACNNGVLILLAVDQRQVFISTGAGAREALSDKRASAVVAAAAPLLRKGLKGEAVLQMTVDVGLGLAGAPTPPQDGEDGLDWVGVAIFSVVGLVIGGSIWKQHRRKKEYKACQRMLAKIKHEQDQLRSHAWSRPASCPVCLEDFSTPLGGEGSAAPSAPPLGSEEAGPSSGSALPSAPLLPVDDLPGVEGLRRRGVADKTAGKGAGAAEVARPPVTLRCGHTFCEPCLEQWLDAHTNCPICRQDVTALGGPPPTKVGDTQTAEAAQRAERAAQEVLNADLAFRLFTLQRFYPWYITDDAIGRWTGDAARTGTFDWEGTREFQLRDPSVATQQRESGASGFGTSFGGGSSAGGGGGGGAW